MHARNAESSNPSKGVAVRKAFNFDDIERKARKAKDNGIFQRRVNQIQQEEITKSLAKRKSRVGSSKDKTPTKASGSDLATEAVAEHTAEEGNHTSPAWKTFYKEDLFEIRMSKKDYSRERHNETRKERRKLKRERGLGEASRRSPLIVKLELPRDLFPRDLGASPMRKTSFTDRLKTAHLKNTPSTTTSSPQSPSLLKAQTEGVECQNLVEAEGETFPGLGLEGLMTDDALQVPVPQAQNFASMTRTPTPSFAKAADRPRPQSSSTPQSQPARFATPQAPETRPPSTSTSSQRPLTLSMRPPTPSIVLTNWNPQANKKQLSDDMVHVFTAFPKDIKECPTLRIIGTTDPTDELLKDQKTKDMYGQTFDCQWRVFALYNARYALNPEYKPLLSGDKWIKDDILIMKAPGDELEDNAARCSHPKLELNLDRFKHPTPNEDGSHTYRISRLFKVMVEIEPLLPSYPPLGLHNLSKLSPTARDCILHTSAHVNQVRLLARVDYNKDDSGLVKCDIQTYLGDKTEFPRNFPPAKKASEMSRLRGEAIKNTEHPTPFKLAIQITWPSWCKESARNEPPKDDDEQMTRPENIATQGSAMQIPDDMPEQFSLDRRPSAPDPVLVSNPAHSNSGQGARSPIAPVPAPPPLELSSAMRYGIVQPPATSSGVTNTTKQVTSDAIELSEENGAPPQGGSAIPTKSVEVIDLDDLDNDEGAIEEMPNPPNSQAPMSPVKHGRPSPRTSTMSRLLSQSDYVKEKQQIQSTPKTIPAPPNTLQERASTPLPRSTSLATRDQVTTGQTAAHGASRKEQSTFVFCVWVIVDEKDHKTPKTWKDHPCHICNAKFPNFPALRDHLASPENHAEYKSIRILYDKAGSACDIWARLSLTGKDPLATKKVFEEVQDSPESEQAWSWLPSLALPPASVASDKAAAPASPLRPSTGSPISIQHPAGINSTSKADEVPLRIDIVTPSEHDHDDAAMQPVSLDYQRPPRPQPRDSGVPMNWSMNIVHDPVTRQPLDRDTSIPQYPQPEATSHLLQAHIDLTHRSKDFSDDDKDFVVGWDLFITAKQGRGTITSSLPKTIKQFVCANWVWLHQRSSRVSCYMKQITALTTANRITPAAALEAAMLLRPPVVPKEAWNKVEHGCKWTTPKMLEHNKKNWTALWGSLRWQMERSGSGFTTAMETTFQQFVNVAGHLLIERGQEELKTKVTSILRNMINNPDGTPGGTTKWRDLTASDVIEMLHDSVKKEQHPQRGEYLQAYDTAFAGKIVMEPGDEETDERMKHLLKDYMHDFLHYWQWQRYHEVDVHILCLTGKLSSEALIRQIEYFDRVGSFTDPNAPPDSHPMVVKPPVLKPESLPNVPPEGKRFPIPKPTEMRGRWECKCGIDVAPWNIVHCANQQSKRHKCLQPTYHRPCTDAGPGRTKDGNPTEEVWFCEECKKKAWDRAKSSDADYGGDESDDDDVGGFAPPIVPGADASHDGPRSDAPDTMGQQREKSPNPQPRKKAKMMSTSIDERESGPAIMRALGTNLASLAFQGVSSNAKRQAIGSLDGTDPKRPRIQEPAPAEDAGSILSPGSVPDIASLSVPPWGSKTVKKVGGPCRTCGRTKCTGWNKKLTGEEPPGDGKVWCFNCYHSDWRKKKVAKEKADAPDILSPAQGGFAAQTEADLKKKRCTVRAQLQKERNKYWEMKDDDAPDEAMRAQMIVIDGLAAKHKQLQAATNAAAEGAASERGI